MLGPFVNGASLVGGSLAGAFLGDKISANVRTRMPMVFGIASMGLGIAMLIKVKCLPAMVLALLLGTLIGELCHLETGLKRVAARTKGLVEAFARPAQGGLTQDQFLEKFVAIMVLFCASSTGIFGAMNEGMTGDPSLLIVKSILDLFTAAIFATALGYSVATLAIPQLCIQGSLFFLAVKILPLTSPAMISDFSACGGLILLATGFRIAEIKNFAVANMLPALFLVLPISALWARFVGH
jgi:uncharacterized membrane protein YqgA involved in biofilm formation